MSVSDAERDELVQREDNARIWQHAAHYGDQVKSQQQEMMKMDHIGVNHFKELDECIDHPRVRTLVPPIVIITAQEQEFAVPSVKARDASPLFVQR